MEFKIEFENPNNVIQGERRSKLIKKDSNLYEFLNKCRKNIVDKYPGVKPKRMDFHIELSNPHDFADKEEIVERAQSLQGKNIGNFNMLNGDAFVIETPEVKGYGKTHITVDYIPRCGIKLDDLVSLCK